MKNLPSRSFEQTSTTHLPNIPTINILKQSVSDVDYRQLTLEEQNCLQYVCRYLIRKSSHRHSCEVCVDFAHSCEVVGADLILCHFKAFDEDLVFGDLMMPHEHFAYYIAAMDKTFCEFFPMYALQSSTGLLLKN